MQLNGWHLIIGCVMAGASTLASAYAGWLCGRVAVGPTTQHIQLSSPSVSIGQPVVCVEPTTVHVPAPVVQIHEAPAPQVIVPKPEATVNLTANVNIEKVEAKTLALVDEFGRELPPPKGTK